MHAWEAIQTTLDYIETHMDEALEIEALAEQAALSPFYYQRLFSRLVKKPVREYIRLRRLARASIMLREGDARILDIWTAALAATRFSAGPSRTPMVCPRPASGRPRWP